MQSNNGLGVRRGRRFCTDRYKVRQQTEINDTAAQHVNRNVSAAVSTEGGGSQRKSGSTERGQIDLKSEVGQTARNHECCVQCHNVT